MVLLGDIHGEFNVIINFARRNESGLVQNLIQVGDFGAGFDPNFLSDMDYLNQELANYNVNLYVIRGNHDDPKFFTGEYNWSNIKFLNDYTVLSIEGKNILFVGGAISIDRLDRKENFTWWKDEVFNFEKDRLEELTNIDMVVTHSAPNFVFPQKINQLVMYYAKDDLNLLTDLANERNYFSQMFDILIKKNNITDWFYGHFHNTLSEKHENTNFNLLGINHFYSYE